MKEIKKVCICGLGAIGSGYASRLYEMNPECIEIIVDEERKSRYLNEGIFINNKQYKFNFVTPNEASYEADIILIAVKQHHLDHAISLIKNFVGPDTIILSLLNGIVSEKVVGDTFGMEKILYSFCVGTDMVRIGTHTNFSNIGRIVFGEPINTCPNVPHSQKHLPPFSNPLTGSQNSSSIVTPNSSKVQAVKALFENANIPHVVPEDILRELWWKFMMNVGLNQVSAILGAPYGVFAKIPEARDLLYSASMEVITLAQKEGINLRIEDIQKYIDILATLDPKGKTSMLQDVEAKRKTEVEIFSGTVLELGLKHGIQTPVNEMLYKMLKTIEKQ